MDNTYTRLRILFEQCVDLPEGERERWLDRNVADTGQRVELELMLDADRRDNGFLERDVVARIDQLGGATEKEFAPEHLIGRRFGAFELRRLIGRGGQGTVYLAERVDSDFAQTAAVKLLRRGIHDNDEHRRFRREREILARFEHAGVARLIDGGVSGDGVPYLVMEFVEGETLERWCDDETLDLRARVSLFAQLCYVVAAAHRALIVHRDLKPSNVLVTPDGSIKVLDFGIARLLDEDAEQTLTAIPILTPGYGAPEQASGGPITLATDVHALGVLLRVLLTGEPPPTQPDDAGPLPSSIPPELRWVIDKACAFEAERRYRDAAELGDDVTRFLDARPVLAHPPSRWYVAQKFIDRHRGGVLTTVAVLLGVLASAGVAIWQAKVAREQAQRAESVRDFLLSIFDAAQEDLPKDARPTLDVLARSAAKKLEGDARLTPALRAEFLGTLSMISYSSNDYDEAVAQADRALAVLSAAGLAQSRQALALRIKRASALNALGRTQEVDDELGGYMEAIRSVADETAVEGLSVYSDARLVTGHVDDAVALGRELTAIADDHYGRDSEQAIAMAQRYGDVLSNAGLNRESAVVLEAALERRRAAGIPPDHRLAISLQNLATAKYHLGDHAESERLVRESVALLRTIYTAPHEKIADALFSLGLPLMNSGRTDEAETVMLEAAGMYSALFPPAHLQNAGMLDGLGSLEIRRQRFDKAIEYFERATQLCNDPSLANNPDCGRHWQNLSHSYLKMGRIDDAATANANSLALRRRLLGDSHPAVAGSLAGRASVELERGTPDTALETIDQALAIFGAAGQSESLGGAVMRRIRAHALKDLHRYAEALAVLDQADAIAARVQPDDDEYRVVALAVRAETLADSSRADEARTVARTALTLPIGRAMLGAARWQRLEAMAR